MRKLPTIANTACRKIPAKQDVSELLSQTLEENNSTTEYQRARQSSRRKHENPFKHNLERHDAQFPSPVPTWQNQECTSSSEISKPSALKSDVSLIMFTAPCNLNEEKEQLAMVMRESLRQTECLAMQSCSYSSIETSTTGFTRPRAVEESTAQACLNNEPEQEAASLLLNLRDSFAK